ncbi:ATP-binding protein [Luteolibacter arcticus]|uniref:histidine kinase n=1 Tax=Luteolibacter arcticus TaxID=1581411 RepID=A0ABT3GMQ1_9BACT|nr:ATP-binding protein [Luteolibacter arcticus]MCW1924777.1 ATP-binding protein [Luteolibacter arcticus]
MMEDFSDPDLSRGIQPHGLLIALHGDDFLISQVSANAGHLIGRDPRDLAGASFLDFVDPSARALVEASLREAWRTDPKSFRVAVLPPGKSGAVMTFEAIAHSLPDGITVVEMERDPVPQQWVSPSPGPDSSLRLVSRSLLAVASLVEPVEIAGMLARELQHFTGFDRVLVARLEEDGSGEIVADEHEDGMESLLGLHVPASALPPASRGRFEAGQLRYFHDAAASPVPLVPSICPRNGAPLDLSRAVLRSLSPTWVRQLAALEVASGMTLPLVVDDRLWGLVICQHRRQKYIFHEQRAATRLCALVLSAQIAVKQRALEDGSAAEARERALRLVAGLKDGRGFIETLHGALPAFVALFAADGGAVFSGPDIHTSGSVPEPVALSALRDALKELPSEGPCITDRAGERFSSLAGSLPRAAGVVVIHLGDESWLLTFRDETVRHRHWTRDLSVSGNAGREEVIRGTSAPWPSATTVLVTEVRSGILDLARHSSAGLERSNRELRRFAGVVAHEVKNQLQPGVLALSMLRSGLGHSLSPDFSKIAEMGERSLTGLAKFTAEMLDFAEAEMSDVIEEIDLHSAAEQVVDQLRIGQAENSVSFGISPLPRIRGLRIQMRHVLSNLVRNAVLHGRFGARPLHVQVGSMDHPVHGAVVFVRDDGRGIPIKDQQRMFDYFARGRESQLPGSGIGLAYCAQIIQRQGQRLWVESAPGEGAVFYFTVSLAEGESATPFA